MRTMEDLQEDQRRWSMSHYHDPRPPGQEVYERRWARLVIDHRPPEDWCWAIPTGKPGSPYDGGTDEAIDGRIKEYVFQRALAVGSRS